MDITTCRILANGCEEGGMPIAFADPVAAATDVWNTGRASIVHTINHFQGRDYADLCIS